MADPRSYMNVEPAGGYDEQDYAVEEYTDNEPTYDNLEESYRPTVNEAVRRIQVAKLYEALLTQRFFAEGSTRDPEIQDSVEEEIKGFILQRLEELLGIRQLQHNHVPQAFDDEQIQALKAVADRALRRNVSPTVTPTPVVAVTAPDNSVSVNVVHQNVPNVNKLYVPVDKDPPQPKRVSKQPAPQPKPTQRPQKPQSKPTQSRKARPVQQEEQEYSSTDKNYSQAVSRRHKPQPMPSQALQDALNAKAAESNASGSSVLNVAASQGGSAGVGALMAQLLSGNKQ